MKLSEIRQAYEDLSGKLSDINRQLAFAGIGIIWIFRVSTPEKDLINQDLRDPLILLVLSLSFDILQYLYQTLAWYFYYCYKKQQDFNEDSEVNEPESLNIPCWILFILKVISLATAYGFLIVYLASLWL